MVHLSEAVVSKLKSVGREVIETVEAEGYTITAALQQNDAFVQSKRPASDLERELVVKGARLGARSEGLWIEHNAGGVALTVEDNGRLVRFHIRKVRLTKAGEYKALCNEGSSLLRSEPALIPDDNWVFGFVMGEDHTLTRLIAAEIVGFTGNRPMRLLFDDIIDLMHVDPPLRFTSADEELEGFEDLEDEDSGVGPA